jgi:NAD(P)-dependent dehydrogenase (short-subunit alcohol dehydrogenase family)
MEISFKGQVAIVTGATQGIGYSIASMLIRENCHVIYTGRSKTPDSILEGGIYAQLDLSDQKSCNDFIETVIKKLPGIDILINNAGIQIPASIESVIISDWNDVLAVNLTGPLKLIQAVVPQMKKKKYGKILNVSSVAGIISKPGQSAYSATKSGLLGLTRSIALDLANYNILVNAICPGTTQTTMVETLLSTGQKEAIIKNVPLGRLATPDEIAAFVLFLVSGLNSYMTGQTVVVDGGYTIQ